MLDFRLSGATKNPVQDREHGEAEADADERGDGEAGADWGERDEPGGDQAAPPRSLDVRTGEADRLPGVLAGVDHAAGCETITGVP